MKGKEREERSAHSMHVRAASEGWTTTRDVQLQLHRLWDRGELLRSMLGDEPLFPLRLALKGPSSGELAEVFEQARGWIAGILALSGIRVEWREFTHRILGAQRVPASVWVDNLGDALAIIGKQREAARFSDVLALTRSRRPELVAWLEKRPLQALALADDWERLLAVVEWCVRHPRPGIYLRQMDIPRVHTKFVEEHRGVLAQWLDLSLPAEAISADRAGIGQFASRFGFLDKPTRIRFRVLDASLATLPGPRLPDVTLDATSFSQLLIPMHRVFITENETNFLALPATPGSIVIFGAGYGWDALARAAWLARCNIHYWGDIDTHGFAILDQLRNHFPHVESFLMDRATLIRHEPLWGEEREQVVHDLPRLASEEAALFDDLRDNRIRPNLRLEQERVGFQSVQAALQRLPTPSLPPDSSLSSRAL